MGIGNQDWGANLVFFLLALTALLSSSRTAKPSRSPAAISAGRCSSVNQPMKGTTATSRYTISASV